MCPRLTNQRILLALRFSLLFYSLFSLQLYSQWKRAVGAGNRKREEKTEREEEIRLECVMLLQKSTHSERCVVTTAYLYFCYRPVVFSFLSFLLSSSLRPLLLLSSSLFPSGRSFHSDSTWFSRYKTSSEKTKSETGREKRERTTRIQRTETLNETSDSSSSSS